MRTYYTEDAIVDGNHLTKTFIIPDTFWEYIVVILNFLRSWNGFQLVFVEINPNNSLEYISLETYNDWEELIINWPIYRMGLSFYVMADLAQEDLNALDA